jgi:hypothetical protein
MDELKTICSLLVFNDKLAEQYNKDLPLYADIIFNINEENSFFEIKNRQVPYYLFIYDQQYQYEMRDL